MSKKNQPVYEEMRSLSPYFLTLSGIYIAIMTVLAAAFKDYTLVAGGVYGIIIAILNFLALGKTAQKALKKREEKAANTYMSAMYCLRYLGLFALLTIGALAPFISLIASVIPLFFPRIAIMIRTLIRKED